MGGHPYRWTPLPLPGHRKCAVSAAVIYRQVETITGIARVILTIRD